MREFRNVGVRISRWCRLTFLVFVFGLVGLSVTAFAQTYEIGMPFAGMHLHKIDEAPLGVGARFDYNFLQIAAADLEFIHYPENPAGNFGESTVLIGCRLGKHFDRFGVFGAVRPGVIHFGGTYFAQRLDQKTRPMMNVGGILEYYPSRRTILRINFDDAIIYYGDAHRFNRPSPDTLGTVHNLQPGFGFGYRF